MEKRDCKRRVFGAVCVAMAVATAFFVVKAIAFSNPDRLAELPAWAYFTMQSNAMAAIWFAWLGLRALNPAVREVPPVVSMWVTVYLTVTGLVYWTVLVPMLGGDSRLFSASNIWTHTAAPIFAIAVFTRVLRGKSISLCGALLTLVYPIKYLGFSYIVQALTGVYTYPFLDPAEVGTFGVVLALMGMTMLIAALALMYRGIWNRHSEGVEIEHNADELAAGI